MTDAIIPGVVLLTMSSYIASFTSRETGIPFWPRITIVNDPGTGYASCVLFFSPLHKINSIKSTSSTVVASNVLAGVNEIVPICPSTSPNSSHSRPVKRPLAHASVVGSLSPLVSVMP